MSRFTKVSTYRNGNLRFGSKEAGEPVNSEVTTYKLSPEELKNYQGDGFVLTKEKYLDFKAIGLTDKEIQQKADLNNNQLHVLKKRWGLVGERGKPKVEITNQSKPVAPLIREKNHEKPQQEQPHSLSIPEKKVVSNEVFKNLQEEYEHAREQIKMLDSLLNERENDLKEANDKIERLQKLRSEDVALIDRLNTEQVVYKELENQLITPDQHEKLKGENSALKAELSRYQNQYLNLADKISRLKNENQYLSERNEELLLFEEKYFATSKALKLHLQ